MSVGIGNFQPQNLAWKVSESFRNFPLESFHFWRKFPCYITLYCHIQYVYIGHESRVTSTSKAVYWYCTVYLMMSSNTIYQCKIWKLSLSRGNFQASKIGLGKFRKVSSKFPKWKVSILETSYPYSFPLSFSTVKYYDAWWTTLVAKRRELWIPNLIFFTAISIWRWCNWALQDSLWPKRIFRTPG